MTADDLIARIDYALLRPEIGIPDLVDACDACKAFRFNSLCVAPWLVESAAERLKETGVRLGSVAAFPLGTSTLGTKSFETEEAVRNEATLIDIVLPIAKVASNDMEGLNLELTQLRAWVDRFSVGKVELRGILETGYLTPQQMEQAALALMEAGWDGVKTSTGFGPKGADPDEVARLSSLLGGRIKVKAAGGIRSAEDMLAMVQAGADLVGTGNGPAIAQELREMESRGKLPD